MDEMDGTPTTWRQPGNFTGRLNFEKLLRKNRHDYEPVSKEWKADEARKWKEAEITDANDGIGTRIKFRKRAASYVPPKIDRNVPNGPSKRRKVEEVVLTDTIGSRIKSQRREASKFLFQSNESESNQVEETGNSKTEEKAAQSSEFRMDTTSVAKFSWESQGQGENSRRSAWF